MKLVSIFIIMLSSQFLFAQNSERIEQAKKLIESQFKDQITYNKIYEHDRGFYSDFIVNCGAYVMNISSDLKEFNKTLVYQFSEKNYQFLVDNYPGFIFYKLEPPKNGITEISISYKGNDYEFTIQSDKLIPINK